jgi:hypothetical protein
MPQARLRRVSGIHKKTPENFDPKELPTAPDRGVPCPACSAEGSKLVEIPDPAHATRVRMVRRLCDTCWGKRKIDRDALARYLADTGRG